MAWEALNNLGSQKRKMIVILNDNDMSIAPAVGAVSSYLSKLISSSHLLRLGKSLSKWQVTCQMKLKEQQKERMSWPEI